MSIIWEDNDAEYELTADSHPSRLLFALHNRDLEPTLHLTLADIRAIAAAAEAHFAGQPLDDAGRDINGDDATTQWEQEPSA